MPNPLSQTEPLHGEHGEPRIEMNYGKSFRIVRAAFGLSQAQLASLLGIGQSQISLIEAGRRLPSQAVIDALADGLRIPRHLIILLGSEKSDLDLLNQSEADGLARSLLRLLVSAADSPVQPPLPYYDKKRSEDE